MGQNFFFLFATEALFLYLSMTHRFSIDTTLSCLMKEETLPVKHCKMRLLNVKTMRVESFPTRQISAIPDYVILSHRWQDEEEVSFHDIQGELEKIQHKKGYQKILKCCEIASSTGFEYVWIDTCCINKSDENELTHTLAAMFRYYRDSQACYTYLADVSGDDNPFDEGSEFRRSKWFTRGWTLQELVAPLYVTFFDRDWNEIGTKSNLRTVIADVTGISPQVLAMNYGGAISIAQRQAWAKDRQTKEIEDQAYSMMGLLGVKIPVKYGEGEAAFRKIKDEIERLKNNDLGDPSNFNVSSWKSSERQYRFLLPIREPLARTTVIEYPDVSGPIWKVSQEEIELRFNGSGSCAVFMFKNTTGHVFAICLGVHNYHIWCSITTDCQDEDIKSVAKAYWDGDKGGARWENMDRRGLRLLNGEVASLAIKRGRRDGKGAFFIEVSANGFWPEKVGPGVFPGWWKG
ncbi:heterokaryon incompatibility protein-domain-containing protein [Jackrogersella minutella]|nr:heterokaryon incompatibility protein-domain-containing protein [Jackrogersella minutella]